MPRLKKILESHNNKLHVKKDDTVIVITGKDKGKKGRVIAAYPRENRVLVEGVNMLRNILVHRKLIHKAVLSNKKRQFTFPTLCTSIRKAVK